MIKKYNRRQLEKRRRHQEMSRERRAALKKLKEFYRYDYPDRDSIDGDFEGISWD